MVAAGEPLNPEVIEQVRQAWGITVRDGFGQTETTAQVGNTPGQPVKLGSMGRPLPGYEIALVDPVSGKPAEEGEICLDLSSRPLGLMIGYQGDPEQDAEAMRAVTTTPATWPPGTPTATSPTWAGPTTCSRPATTGSARSSWRAC